MARPDLASLEAFACIARHRSFRKAAIERGVSPSAISHTLRLLEEQLGVKLLNRTNRSVTLSEPGERLLVRLMPPMRDIAEAIDEMNNYRDSPIGTLRLNVPRAATQILLKPVLGKFLAAYPQIQLEITTDDGLVDIVERGFHAGVRFGENLAQDMIALPFGPSQRFAVVGSPTYVASRGIPVTPHDLLNHACIGRRFPSGVLFSWEFERDGEPLNVAVEGPLVLDDGDLMVSAALNDVGFAFVYEQQVQSLIAAGRLVRVLADWCPAYPGFFLYFPSRRQMPAVLRAFINMIQSA